MNNMIGGSNCIRKTIAPTIYVLILTTSGAESAHNSPSANNDNTRRKRERERARYAAKSQEEKNARNLRQREAHRKKKSARCIPKLWCYKYIICSLDGSRFQGFYKLAGRFNTSTCFVIFFSCISILVLEYVCLS